MNRMARMLSCVPLLAVALAAAAMPTVAQAQAQCKRCVDSRISIYHDSGDEAAAYCQKIAMCAGGRQAIPQPPARLLAAPVPNQGAPRPAPNPQVLAAGGPAPNGTYECANFSGGRLQQQGGLNFTLAGGRYTDAAGQSGTVSQGANVTFTGAGLDGQRAHYQGGQPPTFSMLGADGLETASCQLSH